MPYKHTQIGYFLIVVLLAVAIEMFFLGHLLPSAGHLLPLAILFLVLAVLFSSLTVSVDPHEIKLSFGLGAIRKKIALADIESCQVCPKRCCSWGIHGWPGKSWMYNVSGFRSVELLMKNGIKYYIGTDQPQELEKAILEAMKGGLQKSL